MFSLLFLFCLGLMLGLFRERRQAPLRFKQGIDTERELNNAFQACQSCFTAVYEKGLELANSLNGILMTRADTDSRWEKSLEQLRLRMNDVIERATSIGRQDGWVSPEGQDASAGNMSIEHVQGLKALLYEWRRELPEQGWSEFERLCEQFDANVRWLNRLMETYYTHMPLERAERSYRPMSYLRVSK